MNQQPDKLANSWEISILESYLGKYAQYFSYDGVKAICKVLKASDDDCDFNLELIYGTDSKEVVFYLQPIDGNDEDCTHYPKITSVEVADPKSNDVMYNAVKGIFTAFDVENRLECSKAG